MHTYIEIQGSGPFLYLSQGQFWKSPQGIIVTAELSPVKIILRLWQPAFHHCSKVPETVTLKSEAVSSSPIDLRTMRQHVVTGTWGTAKLAPPGQKAKQREEGLGSCRCLQGHC